jgi:hypothetical protein
MSRPAGGVDLNASSVTKRTFIFPDLDHARWTALQHAVQKQRAEAVRVLLEWGAEPDATEPGGPLWHVIEHVLERVHGGQSPKDALEVVRATAGQSRP